jgi:hypothetical protein
MIIINGSPNRQSTQLSNKLPETSTKNSFTALQQEDDDHYDTVDFTVEHATNNHREVSKLLSPPKQHKRKTPFNATTQQNMLVVTEEIQQMNLASNMKLHRLAPGSGRGGRGRGHRIIQHGKQNPQAPIQEQEGILAAASIQEQEGILEAANQDTNTTSTPVESNQSQSESQASETSTGEGSDEEDATMNESEETGSSQPEETMNEDIGDNTEPIIGHFGLRIEAMVDDESIDMNQVRELLSKLADAHCTFYNYREMGGDNRASTKGISWENLNGLDDAELRKYLNLSMIQWGNPRSANAKLLKITVLLLGGLCWVQECWRAQEGNASKKYGVLKELGWYLKSHTLHQSQEVNVAFILGRHPEKTYKDGLRDTVSDFINQQQSNGSTPTIYLDVVYSKLVVKDTKVPVLAIQCGMNDRQTIDNILKGGAQHPTIDIVSEKLRRSNRSAFEKAIEEHMDVCQCSTAITITGINHLTAEEVL